MLLLAVLMSITVQGVVLAEDGSPIPGALVTLVQAGASIQVVTDARGEFSFPNVRPEVPSTVRVEFAGLKTRELRNVTGAIDLRIMMRPDRRQIVTLCGPYTPMVLPDSLSITTLTSFSLSKLPF